MPLLCCSWQCPSGTGQHAADESKMVGRWGKTHSFSSLENRQVEESAMTSLVQRWTMLNLCHPKRWTWKEKRQWWGDTVHWSGIFWYILDGEKSEPSRSGRPSSSIKLHPFDRGFNSTNRTGKNLALQNVAHRRVPSSCCAIVTAGPHQTMPKGKATKSGTGATGERLTGPGDRLDRRPCWFLSGYTNLCHDMI